MHPYIRAYVHKHAEYPEYPLLGYTAKAHDMYILSGLYRIRSDFAQYNHLIFAPALVEEKDTIAHKVHEYSRR